MSELSMVEAFYEAHYQHDHQRDDNPNRRTPEQIIGEAFARHGLVVAPAALWEKYLAAWEHAPSAVRDEALDVERLVGMADAAVGEVLTGNDYARYYKAIREHFRARLLRAAEYARLAPARDDTSAWLIERGQSERQVPTVWWTGSSWSSDANKAMRFPDRDAAAAYNEEHSPIPAQRDRFGRVTEHRWLRDTNGGASSGQPSNPLQPRSVEEDDE